MAKKTATKFEEKKSTATRFVSKDSSKNAGKGTVTNSIKSVLPTSNLGTVSELIGAAAKKAAPTTFSTPTTPTYDTSAYDAMYNDFAARQQEIAARQKAETTEEYNKQLKEAYIGRMQNQKSLNENLVQMGIRGGATETANLNLLSNYQGTRNSLNADKMKALQTIDNNLSDNLFNYKQQMDMAKQSYLEQRQAEDRQRSQTLEDNAAAQQAALEAEQRAYAREDALWAREQAAEKKAQQQAEKKAQQAQKKAEKQAAQNDFWTAKYSGWYNTKNLNKAYKNATSQAEKTIIKARIGYLKADKKGY